MSEELRRKLFENSPTDSDDISLYSPSDSDDISLNFTYTPLSPTDYSSSSDSDSSSPRSKQINNKYVTPPSPPYSPSSHQQIIEEIEVIMDKSNEPSIETSDYFFNDLSKKGTGELLKVLLKRAEQLFPHYLTTKRIKEMLEIACSRGNYDTMDFLFPLGVEEIDEAFLTRILSSSSKM